MKQNTPKITKLANTSDTTADTSYTAIIGKYYENGGTIRDIYNSLLKKHVSLRDNNNPDSSIKATISSNNIKIQRANTDNRIISLTKPTGNKNQLQNRLHLHLPKPLVSTIKYCS